MKVFGVCINLKPNYCLKGGRSTPFWTTSYNLSSWVTSKIMAFYLFRINATSCSSSSSSIVDAPARTLTQCSNNGHNASHLLMSFTFSYFSSSEPTHFPHRLLRWREILHDEWSYCHSLPLLLLLDRKFWTKALCDCVCGFFSFLLLCRIYKMSLTLLVSRVLLISLTWYLPSVPSLHLRWHSFCSISPTHVQTFGHKCRHWKRIYI